MTSAEAASPSAARRVKSLDLCVIRVIPIGGENLLGTDDNLILATLGPILRDNSHVAASRHSNADAS